MERCMSYPNVPTYMLVCSIYLLRQDLAHLERQRGRIPLELLDQPGRRPEPKPNSDRGGDAKDENYGWQRQSSLPGFAMCLGHGHHFRKDSSQTGRLQQKNVSLALPISSARIHYRRTTPSMVQRLDLPDRKLRGWPNAACSLPRSRSVHIFVAHIEMIDAAAVAVGGRILLMSSNHQHSRWTPILRPSRLLLPSPGGGRRVLPNLLPLTSCL